MDPSYVELHGDFRASFKDGYTVLVYVVEGRVKAEKEGPFIPAGHLMVFSREIEVSGEGRIIVLAGRPLYEPIAWYGPIVMNAEEQTIKVRGLEEGDVRQEEGSPGGRGPIITFLQNFEIQK